MPYKTGKMKGELTTPEIRKLIKAHNVLVSIKIPKGAKREDIIKLVEKKGYKVDHEKQALIPRVEMKRRPKVDMKKADKTLPKPKTKEEKEKAKKEREKKKQKMETEAFKKREAQVKALGKVVARRKKGEIKAPKQTVPEFDTIKQLEKYFNSSLEKFRKEIMKYSNKIKGIDDKKKINEERKKIRQYGVKNVADILEANDELFEDDDDKYEELESRYDNVDKLISTNTAKRLEELKK
jgi:hypothetical protein